MKSQRGGIVFNVLAFILIVAIGVLAYVILRPGDDRTDTTQSDAYAPRNLPVRTGAFSDGLGRANAATRYPLDEFGAGVASVEIFNRDLDGDGTPDRITRTRHENGTDHFYDEYKLELRRGGEWIDITPDDFRTVEGAECALQRFQFVFVPEFTVVKIGRPWRESWSTPTTAVRTEYRISGNRMKITGTKNLNQICDVAGLF